MWFMKQLKLLIFLLTIGFVADAQINYLNYPARYRWYAGKFDSTITIPYGLTPSIRTGGFTGPASLFYKTSDSTVYVYTGTQWISVKGTGSSGSADSSIFLIDTTYTRLAQALGTDTLLLKSFRWLFNGVAITPTVTDSTVTVPIVAATTGEIADSLEVIRQRYNRSFDTIIYVNDTTVIWQRYDGTSDTLQFHPGTSGTSYTFNYPLSETGGSVSLDTASGKWRSEGYNDTKYYNVSNPDGYVATRDRFGFSGEDVRRTADAAISFSNHKLRFDSLTKLSIINPNDSLVFENGELRLNLSDAGAYGLQTKSLWWNDDGNGYTGYLGVGGVNGWTMSFMGSSVGLFGPDSVRFEGYLKLKDKASAPTSVSGYGFVYPGTDGKLYFKNHSGTEYDLTATGSGMSNPMTTTGDIIYSSDGSGTPARLGAGTSGYVLTSNGAGAAPSWQAAAGGSLTKGTTTIASSATRRILYDSSGVLSNNGSFLYNASGELIVGGSTDNGSYVFQVNGGNAYFSSNIYTAGTILEMGNGSRVNFGGAGSNPSILANSTVIFAAKRDNSDYVDFTAKNLIATGTVTTGNPGSGAGTWKLGTIQSSSGLTIDPGAYIEVSIGGVTYWLALAAPPIPKPQP